MTRRDTFDPVAFRDKSHRQWTSRRISSKFNFLRFQVSRPMRQRLPLKSWYAAMSQIAVRPLLLAMDRTADFAKVLPRVLLKLYDDGIMAALWRKRLVYLCRFD